MKKYLIYNKEEVLRKIDLIDITKEGSSIITKYNDRIIKTATVSNRYEIFDIKSYLKSKIDLIEKNFTISHYYFYVKGGVQILDLISDTITINNSEYHKGFFILNSSDKSRCLNFNAGLHCKSTNWYFISPIKNIGLTKKHLTGISDIAENSTIGLNDETFNEQIELLKDLVNHRISYSNLYKIIVPDDTVKVNLSKMASFNSTIVNLHRNKQLTLLPIQLEMLKMPIEKITFDGDFYLEAFQVFQIYLGLFNRQDSYLIKKESERIMQITQSYVRNSVLESLGI